MSAWLGLRLAVAGGAEALLRLAFTATGVAIGVALLLVALTAPAALNGREVRSSWQHVVSGRAALMVWPEPPVESADGALFLAVTDYYDGTRMTRAYVAALGDDPPVPPGLDRLPGPGEVATSPAMRELLESTPDDQLDDRYPGRVTMTIGEAGLKHDNELVALIGRTPDQLRDVRSVREVRGFSYPPPNPVVWFAFGSFLTPFLLIGVAHLLAPLLILIVIVARVAWSQRARRLAAIRLVGATRPQTAVIAAAETGLAAAVGSLLAWGLYEVVRRILAATLVFQDGHFWLDDLAVPPVLLALVLVGAPVLVMLTAIMSLSGAQTTPLAVSRPSRRRVPKARAALLLAGGIGGSLLVDPIHELAGDSLGSSAILLSAAFTLGTIVGFVLAGPWLCMVAGQAIVHLSRGVPGLIAARRIAADPHATFRAVSGVTLAVAVLTFIGSTSSPFQPAAAAPDESREGRLRPGVVLVFTGGVPEQRVAPLLSDETVVVRTRSGGWVVACAELARVRDVPCPHPGYSGFIEPGQGPTLPTVIDVYIPTDGTLAAENRVRTQAANLVPNAIINTDRDPVGGNLETLFGDLTRLVQVAGLFVLVMAAFGLTAGMFGGLLERRRPFALLRASGMRLGELRWVVLLETGVTMVFTSIAGVGLGIYLAYAASRQGGLAWQWPDGWLLAQVGGGVLVALALSTFVLPLLNMTTRFNTVRYE